MKNVFLAVAVLLIGGSGFALTAGPDLTCSDGSIEFSLATQTKNAWVQVQGQPRKALKVNSWITYRCPDCYKVDAFLVMEGGSVNYLMSVHGGMPVLAPVMDVSVKRAGGFEKFKSLGCRRVTP